MSTFSDWTLAEKIEFRKTLAKAIATGARVVRYADRNVEYRGLDEMKQIAGLLDEEINTASGTPRLRRLQINARKGIYS